ncbi:transposase family protein [Streptomyces sp. NPDC001312]|uniref:transposase family protein n=1 Tax=Streptomyces sp. NPDC001312 TaxID=3364561 RepID=UPI00369A1C5F
MDALGQSGARQAAHRQVLHRDRLVLADQPCGELVVELAVPDPRRVRGRRYRLGSLLALCPVAVLGGATSLAAIARFAADIDHDLREQLGLCGCR